MPPKAKGGGAAAKKKNGYQMPEKFDEGYILKDIFKTNWVLGKPIGQGGFGLIYLANKGETKPKSADEAKYVIKIEPKDNGPLFCETHFYVNCAKEDDIKAFVRTYNLKHLAMPKYISSGICQYNEKDYRFLLMDRFTKDLQSVLVQSPTHQINEIGVLCLMRQILYTLEYIHQRGYAHGDIKGANLMLMNDHESYLVDYGLAFRYMRDNVHQKYEIKPERRHNGTIEYTSRDAHSGAQTSRRADLEILGYCVIHWMSGSLPWIDLITNNEKVAQSKIQNMNNVKEFVKNSLGKCSEAIRSFTEYYLNEVNKLEFIDEPPYAKIQSKITDALRQLGHSATSPDNFYIFSQKAPTKTPKKAAAAALASTEVINESKNETTNGNTSSRKPKRQKDLQVIENDQEDETEIKEPTRRVKTRKAATANDENQESEVVAPKPTRTRGRTPLKKAKEIIVDNEIENDDTNSNFSSENSNDFDFKLLKSSNDKPKSSARLFNSPSSLITPDLDIKKTKSQIARLIDEEWQTEPKSNQKANDNIKKESSSKPSTPSKIQNGHHKKTADAMNNSDFGDAFEDEIESHEKEAASNNKHLNGVKTNGNGVHHAPLSPRYELRVANNKPTPTRPNGVLNAAQLDVINKKTNNHLTKQEHHQNSPFALDRLTKDDDNENEIILIKKRKNVQKSTVATQTESSFIYKLKTQKPVR